METLYDFFAGLSKYVSIANPICQTTDYLRHTIMVEAIRDHFGGIFVDLEDWIEQMQSALDVVLCRAPSFKKRRLTSNSQPN